jgi:hypothetical protein
MIAAAMIRTQISFASELGFWRMRRFPAATQQSGAAF